MNKTLLLLIEDNPLLTGLYRAAFEKKGFEVIFAHDGESGLTLAKARKPHLIVLDLLMPGMDGYEVLARIKNDAETAHIKVVILTIINEKGAQKKAVKLGAVDFLVKSDLTLAKIVERIITHCK